MENLSWLHFASRTGSDGVHWVEGYRRHEPILEIGKQALGLMREGKSAIAESVLREFVSCVEGVIVELPSQKAVLDRFRFGIEGYYLYCRRDYQGAALAMDHAHTAVARALTSPCLMMLAIHCQEFRLHHARIAVKERRWSAANKHIERARAMLSDSHPLCTTEGGQNILWSHLSDFFLSVEPLSVEEHKVAKLLLDPLERSRLFEKFTRDNVINVSHMRRS